MTAYRWLFRRLNTRKSLLLLIILVALVCFQQYHQYNLIESENIDRVTPLPPLDSNDEPNLEKTAENTAQINHKQLEKERISPIKDVNVVFNDLRRFNQEVSFEYMEEGKQYPIKFNDKDVGKVLTVQSFNEETEPQPGYEKENATFFSLVRNEDLRGILKSIQSVEYRFNSKYHYDWVFANDKPFHPGFKEIVSNIVSGNAFFEEIPVEYWSYPDWIDMEAANKTRRIMKSKQIKYGDSESYRHMCRFNSGFFFHLPRMKNYKYYWRVEPDIEYRCDIFYQDIFKHMRKNGKKYAFTLAPLELHTTVEKLWDTVNNFFKLEPKLVSEDNNVAFLTEDDGKTFNMCHFWSNFEVGDMDFFRLESYTKFFNYLDQEGGFYYSRWGDAPIHSMAVSFMLKSSELYFLQNSGYFHNPNGDCPWDPSIRKQRRCICLTKNEATWARNSCIPKWFEIHGLEKPEFAPHFEFVNQHKPKEETEETNNDENEDE
ncbi:uncharacterized protein PRCAT00001016001 [Priceomyces carsonii]|uniref:uncharacterized protein n=1 Tax=Priceomyces carsonii TaxID=28549 RepID=UPI002EDB4AE1|nr:unnamed protein product [Priceomyces carsonii]